MLEVIDGFKSSLTTHLQTTDDFLSLPFKAVQRLNELAEGNHIYLTLKYLDRYEVVKFVKENNLKGGRVPVTRDILGRGRKNFPCSSCVVVDWNTIQLKEFICQNKEC